MKYLLAVLALSACAPAGITDQTYHGDKLSPEPAASLAPERFDDCPPRLNVRPGCEDRAVSAPPREVPPPEEPEKPEEPPVDEPHEPPGQPENPHEPKPDKPKGCEGGRGDREWVRR